MTATLELETTQEEREWLFGLPLPSEVKGGVRAAFTEEAKDRVERLFQALKRDFDRLQAALATAERRGIEPLLEALRSAIHIADEARNEWDAAPQGMKAGKLLIALSGHLPGYRADIDAIHAVLALPDLPPAGESGWQPIETAPRDTKHPILIDLGETIPDTPNIRVATFIDGELCEELGERECQVHGGWIIWHNDSDWFIVAHDSPFAWSPIPGAHRPTPPEVGETGR